MERFKVPAGALAGLALLALVALAAAALKLPLAERLPASAPMLAVAALMFLWLTLLAVLRNASDRPELEERLGRQGEAERRDRGPGYRGEAVAVRPSSDDQPGMTYAGAGVRYDRMDPGKLLAQRAAAATSPLLERWGLRELPSSRGESAYVWEEQGAYRAMVTEGLGTKSLVADPVRRITGRTHFDALAQDTVAMIVNDIIVVGAAPQVVTAFWAAGSSDWFADQQRLSDLVTGWASACERSDAAWGGGETEVLVGVVEEHAVDLAGACIGVVEPKGRLVTGDRLRTGDAIVLVSSSGIHANGLTLARRIADSLDDGYATPIADGRTYGEALLEPTHLYVRFVSDLLASGIEVHYMVNITGHGWRKLMRARRELRYVLHTVPPPGALQDFMVGHGGLSPEEAYGNLNMGAGFAVYVPRGDADTVISAAHKHGFDAWAAGSVTEGPREVVIEPVGVVFPGESLEVRA